MALPRKLWSHRLSLTVTFLHHFLLNHLQPARFPKSPFPTHQQPQMSEFRTPSSCHPPPMTHGSFFPSIRKSPQKNISSQIQEKTHTLV